MIYFQIFTTFRYKSLKNSDFSVFQSTLPRGERPFRTKLLNIYAEFQSTLPRGERRDTQALSPPSWSFNPRSHAESDPKAAVSVVAF